MPRECSLGKSSQAGIFKVQKSSTPPPQKFSPPPKKNCTPPPKSGHIFAHPPVEKGPKIGCFNYFHFNRVLDLINVYTPLATPARSK